MLFPMAFWRTMNSFVTRLRCCPTITLLANSKTQVLHSKAGCHPLISIAPCYCFPSAGLHFPLLLPLHVPLGHTTQPLHILHKRGLFTWAICCSFPSSTIYKLTGISTITQLFNAGAEQGWPYYQALTQLGHFTTPLHSATFKPTPASSLTVSLGSRHGRKPQCLD